MKVFWTIYSNYYFESTTSPDKLFPRLGQTPINIPPDSITSSTTLNRKPPSKIKMSSPDILANTFASQNTPNKLTAWYDNMVRVEQRGFDTSAKNTLTVMEHPATFGYSLQHSLREPEILRQLRVAIENEKHAAASASADEAQFICLLLKMIGARNIIGKCITRRCRHDIL